MVDPGPVRDFVASVRPGGPILDLGCGPGRHLALLGPAATGADAAEAMVRAARATVPAAPVTRCDLAVLPYRAASFAGVWASKAHQHLPAADLPLALAELHRVLEPDGRLELTVFTRAGVGDAEHGVAQEVSGPESGDDLPGRLFTWWDPARLAEVVTHAAFDVERCEVADLDAHGIGAIRLSATRRLALPDHVGAAMRLLCCGINPSVHAAEAGVGYVTRSNRFWPALLASGLADVDRDPRLLLRRHRIGMTDLVPRPTRGQRPGPRRVRPSLDRLARLCGWLRPAAVVVVGIDAWRGVGRPPGRARLAARARGSHPRLRDALHQRPQRPGAPRRPGRSPPGRRRAPAHLRPRARRTGAAGRVRRGCPGRRSAGGGRRRSTGCRP
jgi:SAM-dependent methyltransferase